MSVSFMYMINVLDIIANLDLKIIFNLEYLGMPASKKKTETVELVEKKQSDLSVGLIIVWLINIAGSFAVTSYCLYLFANQSYHLQFIPQGLNTQQALHLTIKYLLFMYFATSLLGQIVEFLLGTGDFHRSLVNINSNTLNHTIITAGLMLYDQADLVADGLFIPLLDLYLLGRLLFSVGYAFGTLIGHQSLRSTGFGFTIACIAISGTHIIGFDLIGSFKNIL